MPVSNTEKIERWENVERVLEAMPEHERQKHWDMSQWGEKTDCGTIACAAGHCGLDPWFRERGFTLDFDDEGESEISSVEQFFGVTGSKRIFLNSKRRPVEAVIDEVREYLGELRQVEALTEGLAVPAIGSEWPEQGGVYAGAMVGKNGEPNYLLIVGPTFDNWITWDRAMKWATGVVVGELRDFSLPSVADATALFERAPSLFEKTAYWTNEQHAGYSGHAWAQGFSYGYQHDYFKDSDLRARAVRRVPIQSFVDSVISSNGVA